MIYCPTCQYGTQVIRTRDDNRRRRECLGPLKHRFSTKEVTVAALGDLRHEVHSLQEEVRSLRAESNR